MAKTNPIQTMNSLLQTGDLRIAGIALLLLIFMLARHKRPSTSGSCRVACPERVSEQGSADPASAFSHTTP